jgi:hypothetical protein
MAATGTGLSAAASGTGPLASLLGGGESVLGNMLGGAIKQGLLGGLIGGGISAATGGGFGKGAMTGAMLGGITGAATGLFTPTGMGGFNADLPMSGGASTVGGAPAAVDQTVTSSTGGNQHAIEHGRDTSLVGRTIPTASTFPAAPVAPALTGLGTASGNDKGAFGGEAFAGMMQGIGESVNSERQIEALMESREKDREFLREQQEQRTASYRVPDSALPGGATNPADRKASITAWKYDPATGMIVKAA